MLNWLNIQMNETVAIGLLPYAGLWKYLNLHWSYIRLCLGLGSCAVAFACLSIQKLE